MYELLWPLFVGVLLITMVLAGTLLTRLLLNGAIVYLVVGYLLGPGVFGFLAPDPLSNTGLLEHIAEGALLISLFSAGLKTGSMPFHTGRWVLPLKLAFTSMTLTVGFIAVIGVWGLELSWGAAILLGGILAPTDPVLAAGVQATDGAPDHLRSSLAGEGGLNDGTAYPFVLLGLGIMGLEDPGMSVWRWLAIDLVWATIGGLLVGAALGACVGKLVVYLRTRHHQALGLDEFLSLGLLATAYGLAQLSLVSAFLAVFATGVALQRVREQPYSQDASLGTPPAVRGHPYGALSTHSHHASATMRHAVLGFNEQLEKLAEMAIVLLVGAMLPYATPIAATWWFIPALFLIVRPISVWIGSKGEPITASERMMLSWFGIRGIGSVFYMLFAIRHGVEGTLAQDLISLTLATVTASVLIHGMSIRPLLAWYTRRTALYSRSTGGPYPVRGRDP